jgi:23S rRNA (uracil1939-C5)-methyltransferase
MDRPLQTSPSSSPDAALCPHFGECGGCQSQDVPYAAQVEAKQTALQELLSPFWDGPIPVTPSPVTRHYRNKVDPTFGGKHYPEAPPKGFRREVVLGFKKKGKWYWNLDIEDCLIGPEGFSGLMESVRHWAREREYTPFNSRNKDGFLRVLLVRDGKRTGDRMVVLITNDGDLDREGFIEAVKSAYPATSIQHAIFRGGAEIAAADEIEVLDGAPTIDEMLKIPDGDATRDLRFRISPFSFFQTNSLGTERLYGFLREWVRGIAPATLYDLYGGAGGIAFTCSDLVKEIISVESVPEAADDGRRNAELNGIVNVTFHTQKVETYLRDLQFEHGGLAPDNAVILDPPRAGLHPKALKRLCELLPPQLIYVACKPQVLAKQDLPGLLEHYALEEVRAVDLFPHTRHVELLARLVRR